MKKNKLIAILGLSVALSGVNVFAGTIPKVYLNENKLLMQQSPFIQEGITYIPLRSTEQFGFDVAWDNGTETVTLSDPKNVIVQKVGSTVATVNGESIDLGAAAIRKKGSVYVPVRFVSNALGGQVQFDKVTNSIDVTMEINSSKKDEFGRPIKESNLPNNAQYFTTIPKGVTNELFERRFVFNNLNGVGFLKGYEVEGEGHSYPKTLGKYSSIATITNRAMWKDNLERHLDLTLNLDSAKMDAAWKNSVIDTMDNKVNGTWSDRYINAANEYVAYAKRIGLKIQGDYYVEPSSTYSIKGTPIMRIWVKFRMDAATSTAKFFYEDFNTFKTGVWYVGYADVDLATSFKKDGSNLKVSGGSYIGRDFKLKEMQE